jgi:hypothetical protein
VSYVPRQTSAQNVLPPLNDSQGYINNLIDTYNTLVRINYASNPNFASMKVNFTLYHDIGYTFKVYVMQTAENVSGFLTLIFIPIGGNDPNIILDQNDTFAKLYPLSIIGENITLEHLTFILTNTITQINIAYGLKSSDITGDYLANSYSTAKYLYRLDAGSISQHPNPTANQPDFWTDPVSWLEHNPLVIVFGLVFGGIVGAVTFFRDSIRWVWHHLHKRPEKKVHAQTHEPRPRQKL